MRIKVRVIPSAKKEKIIEENDQLKVYVAAPPVDGKANYALIAALAGHFNVKRNQVILLHGDRSRNKIFAIKSL